MPSRDRKEAASGAAKSPNRLSAPKFRRYSGRRAAEPAPVQPQEQRKRYRTACETQCPVVKWEYNPPPTTQELHGLRPSALSYRLFAARRRLRYRPVDENRRRTEDAGGRHDRSREPVRSGEIL